MTLAANKDSTSHASKFHLGEKVAAVCSQVRQAYQSRDKGKQRDPVGVLRQRISAIQS